MRVQIHNNRTLRKELRAFEKQFSFVFFFWVSPCAVLLFSYCFCFDRVHSVFVLGSLCHFGCCCKNSDRRRSNEVDSKYGQKFQMCQVL